ncbi:hypothetical protein K461DRAFT_278512 [Myriangium duriaei CBS 260.36]|uniref:Uncharacterized protein n=1 Tax=Myriangium duriaei CBS 260.36 TaxID=1168546 RepID=A0A9P4MJP8_9PEZI|nr:hypothetical protein K461DRAFT_278512 [Myriangium duriaei CBS 260.36]
MPRTLPWLKGGGASSPARPRPGKPAPQSAKRPRITCPEANDDDFDTPIRRSRAQTPGTPPTSPPPEPPTPTEQEALHEGYDADDGHMMVEDEFLATAQLYTQHLHYAEYARLKKAARERENATPGKPTNIMAEFVPQHRSVPHTRKPRASSSSSEGEAVISDSTLAGLMESPRKPPTLLLRSQTTEKPPQSPSKIRNGPDHVTQTAKTRLSPVRETKASSEAQARIVLSDNPDDNETTDDDDLDAPIRPRKPLVSKVSYPNGTKHTTNHKHAIKADPDRTQYKRDEPAPPPRQHLTKSSLDADNPGIPLSKARARAPSITHSTSGSTSRSTAEILAERRNKHKAKQAEKSNNTNHDTTTEIPTFLF